MKKVIFLLIMALCLQLTAQEAKPDYSDKVVTIDSTLETLYGVISGEKGEERDWDAFKFLFHPDAKLIPTGKSAENKYSAQFLKPEEYIKMSGKWLVENGFFEKEIHRSVNTFGHITQVFSTYESFHSESDDKPFMRGINSIQLLNDGERWWIVNIYWQQESESNPIPSEYLPD